MIFRRSLLREFSANAIGVFFVLLAIMVTVTVIRYLGQAAQGEVAPEAVLALLGFTMLTYLAVLLALTLFISILITVSRSYRDSEMLIWFSSGLSLTAWIRPVLIFAAPVVITIAVLSFVLTPWSLEKREQYRAQLESKDEVSTIAPGVFRESSHSARVYFVEKSGESDNVISNAFVHSLQHQRAGTMVAKHGYQKVEPNGDRFLVLLNGRRYEGNAGSPDYKITDFEKYSLRIEAAEVKFGAPATQSLSTPELLRSPTNIKLGELAWRISVPISATILSLLAIPLGFVNPRASRSLNLIFAVLIYQSYSNLVSVAQAWIGQGKISFMNGLWMVHACALVLLAILFYRRLRVRPLFRFRLLR